MCATMVAAQGALAQEAPFQEAYRSVGDEEILVFGSGVDGVVMQFPDLFCEELVGSAGGDFQVGAKARSACVNQVRKLAGASQALVPASAIDVLAGVAATDPPYPPSADLEPVSFQGKPQAQFVSEPFDLEAGTYLIHLKPSKQCAFETSYQLDAADGSLSIAGFDSTAADLAAGTYTVQADSQCGKGKWRVTLRPLGAAEPVTKPVTGGPAAIPGIVVLDDDAYCRHFADAKGKVLDKADLEAAVATCVARVEGFASQGEFLTTSAALPVILGLRGSSSATAMTDAPEPSMAAESPAATEDATEAANASSG